MQLRLCLGYAVKAYLSLCIHLLYHIVSNPFPLINKNKAKIYKN